MHVSYLETVVHCKKVFEAYGSSYGYAEDGAEAVAWGEFVGLPGLQTLASEVSMLNLRREVESQFLVEQDDFTVIDCGGQSGLLLGKALVDYAMSRLGLSEVQVVYVQNTSTSRLLAQQAFYVASKGKGCVIIYHTKEEIPVIILSSPQRRYPIVVEGRKVEDLFEAISNEDLLIEKQLKSSNDFMIICLKNLESINGLIEKVLDEPSDTSVTIIESEKLEASWNHSWQYGAKADRLVWDELYKSGCKTLVESTEQSRIRGAGELA